MKKLKGFERKVAVKAILHHAVLLGEGQELVASDFLCFTQASKATILTALDRWHRLGYLSKTELPYRPNRSMFVYAYTGKVGIETQYASFYYGVMKKNILGD